jgi:outer membrane protein
MAAALMSGAPANARVSDLADVTVLGWSLNNLRVALRVTPDYMGSNDYRLRPGGSLNISRHGRQPSFGAPDDGVSLGLFGGRGWSAGLSGRWRSARGNDDDLRGFAKIDGAVEAGAFVNYWPKDWLRVRGEVRHGAGGHHAWVADLGTDALWRKAPLVVSVGPRLSWGNGDFTRTYFGVDPVEAAFSPFGVAPYAPEEATLTAGVLASAEYRLDRHWSVTAVGNYRRLLGEAADSPIVVDLGSPDQFSATLGVRYTLGR